MPSHEHQGAKVPSLRGLAGGVCIAARLPVFAPQPSMPPSMLSTCRLCEAFLRIGALVVRVIAIYGIPHVSQAALERSEALLAMAFERATQSAIPCIVAGDYNCLVESLPTGRSWDTWRPFSCTASVLGRTCLLRAKAARSTIQR